MSEDYVGRHRTEGMSENTSAPPPEHHDRYDHRDDGQRAEDAMQPTLSEPLQDGAVELRAEAEEALASGDVKDRPSGDLRP